MQNMNLTDEEAAVITRRRAGLQKLAEMNGERVPDLDDIKPGMDKETRDATYKHLAKLLKESSS